jgi:hypothetical protein
MSTLFECNMVTSEWKYNRIIAEVVAHSRVVVAGCENSAAKIWLSRKPQPSSTTGGIYVAWYLGLREPGGIRD